MRILGLSDRQGQAFSLTLLVHPGATFPKPPDEKLPMLSPDQLSRLWREFDDLPPNIGLQDNSAAVIARLGYKICRVGLITKHLHVPRGSVLIASRDSMGRVTGLQTDQQWLTCPQIHCVNLIRRLWTKTIEVHPSIIAADKAAVERNVAAICMGGHQLKELSQIITGPAPQIVFLSALEVAA